MVMTGKDYVVISVAEAGEMNGEFDGKEWSCFYFRIDKFVWN